MWELRRARDGWAVESGQYQASTGSAPDWWEKAPRLDRSDGVYLQAFWELSTTRQFSPALGPIPWNRIIEYGRWVRLEPDMILVLAAVVRELDETYLEHLRNTYSRDTEMTRQRMKAKRGMRKG